MSVQDLQLNLVGKDVSASDALRSLARAANVAAKSAGDDLDRMNRRIKTSSDESAVHVTSGFGSKLASWAQSGLAGVLGGVAASVTSTVTSAIGDAGSMVLSQLKSSVIDYNSALENANIGFATMLGSGQKAQAFLKDLGDFAKTTPFEFGNLVSNAQQMMGMGVAAKDVIPTLRALGDSVASMGGSAEQVDQVTLAFDQMVSKGTLDMGNMNQLLQGGVPSALKVLAASYGKTTGEMMKMISTGKVQSADALPRLVKGIEKGTSATAALGGMMDKQSNTFAGAMSNISDAMQQTLAKTFLPFFNVVERGAQSIAKFTSSKQFTAFANTAGRAFGRAMNEIGAALKKVFQDPKVQAAIGRLGASIGKAFRDMGPALSKILPNLVKFGTDVLPSIIDAMTGIVDKVPTLLKWWEKLSSGLAAAGPTVAGVIGFLSDLGGTLFEVSRAIGNFATDAIAGFVDFVSSSKKHIEDFQTWLGGVVEDFGTIGGQIVTGLVSGITGAWDDVMATVQGLINQIPLAARKLLGIASPSKVFRSIGRWVGEGLHQGLLGSVDQIKSTADKLASAITDQFKAKKISKTAKDAGLFWVKQFTDGGSMLQAIAKQRATVLEKLADLKSSRSDMSTGTRDATLGAADITSYAGPGDAVQGIRSLVAKTKLFTKDLNSLSKKGLGGTMLTQLVNGWQSDPDGALSTAQGLLANPTDLKQIIGLQKQLNTAAGALGTAAGNDVYGASIRRTQSKATVLGWEQQAIARRDMKYIARETHIHVNLSGTYAGTKADLAKTVTQVIRDEIKKGTISKDWNKG